MKIFKIIVAVVAVIVVWQAIKFWRDINLPPNDDVTPVLFEIASGEGVNIISNHLFAKGLIRNQWNWETYVWLLRAESKLQAGFYELSRNLTAKELTEILIAGETLNKERVITIIEGWRAVDIANYLELQGAVKADDFLVLVEHPSAEITAAYDFLEPNRGLEGFLFPDTYRIYNDATPAEIIMTLLDNFAVKTKELRSIKAPAGLSFYDSVTLASILEKEVAGRENLSIAADVFLKRLDDGIALQSDATVNYVTGKKTTRPTFADLEVVSPYNTYQNRGLPPTPISNPGLASLTAVFHPQKNDYYFFLTTVEGEAIFSRTYEEHLRNKAFYYP